jgi:hypothetical protein
MRPRFLVQIYRKSLSDVDREYIEDISIKLPITIERVIYELVSKLFKLLLSMVYYGVSWA